MESILKRWEHIEMNCSIPRDEFLCAVRFVLNSSFFSFNNVHYQQTFGTPMGSPLSPIIAVITLQDLEKRVLGTLSFKLPFYFRYVDDIALSVASSMVEFTLNSFNSVHPLQFTLEEGTDDRPFFLSQRKSFIDIHSLQERDCGICGIPSPIP